MKVRSILFSLFFALPVAIFAHVTGTYNVSGNDPLSGKYTGTLTIDQNGDIYNATWIFPNTSEVDTATGVRRGNTLALVFNEGGLVAGLMQKSGLSFGVQEYEIEDNTLKGPWVRYQATQKGFEIAKKIK